MCLFQKYFKFFENNNNKEKEIIKIVDINE